jgi:hypothetical protein
MKIKKITFLGEVENILDSNLDVAVELDDGNEYIVIIATAQNLF